MVAPLLTTKLHIPPQRPGLIPRPHLIEQLNAGLHRKLTLISAPAGFGKTTLLSRWIGCRATGSDDLRAAWLSLDSSDNDPVRFLTYLVAALQKASDSIGQDARRLLESPRLVPGKGSLATEELLTGLINEINAMPASRSAMSDETHSEVEHQSPTVVVSGTRVQDDRDLVLVLDDYHLVETQAIHDVLIFLLEHLPTRLHLVIATRTDPPLPIARLRGQGQVTELRQGDLCFTQAETGAFLEKATGFTLPPDAIAALSTRTEGWIAGLQMAAVSMRDRADIAGFIETFTGSDRFIMDYLVEEVLSRQPPTLQAFLLQTSILDRLSGPLCDTVVTDSQVALATDEPIAAVTTLSELPFAACSGQQVLEHLERTNLFVVALDDRREWYRYHHLFSDLLRQHLRQVRPDLEPTLHRRASQWYERNGPMTQAVAHALSARDHERAAGLVEEVAEAAWMHSKVATFLGWMESLPGDVLHSRPMLGVYYVLALLMSGHPLEVVESCLKEQVNIEKALKEDEVGEFSAGITVYRALVAAYQGKTEESAKLANRALELLPEGRLFLRSLVAGILALAHVYGGDIAAASQALEEAARVSQQAGNILNAVLALCHQAELHILQGQLFRAKEHYDEALALATDARGRRLPVAGMAMIGLGHLLLEWNELPEAARRVREGINLTRRWGEPSTLQGYAVLARIRQAEGNLAEARRLLQKAEKAAARFDATEIDDISVAAYQAQLALAEGNLAEAERWAARRGLGLSSTTSDIGTNDGHASFTQRYLREREYLTLARLLIAKGKSQEGRFLDQAATLLEQLLRHTEKDGHAGRTMEILIVHAIACQARADGEAAAHSLDRALLMARPERYRRIFVDEGEPMVGLLREAYLRGTTPEYVRNLLEDMDVGMNKGACGDLLSIGHPQLVEQPLVEPLSKRELEVLRFLTTSLSSTEIAEHLYVSVNTVRSHIRSIYGKLDAHSRYEAIAHAQKLSLV